MGARLSGAPTAVTIFIGSAPKLAAFALICILAEALGTPRVVAEWQTMLALLAILSMAVATSRDRPDQHQASSATRIAHMGFLLLGFSPARPPVTAQPFYAVTYVLMSLAAFGMILLLSRAGFEAENLEDFRELNQRDRWLAFMMMLILLSLAGLPVMVGFCQARSPAGCTGGRLCRAGRGRRAVLFGRGLLLSALGEVDVFRRSGRYVADRHNGGSTR